MEGTTAKIDIKNYMTGKMEANHLMRQLITLQNNGYAALTRKIMKTKQAGKSQ